ncbi:hypothetical protein HOLDEFILI_03895 [Holdemania filiformis DSM 12042]|uniref:Uncharacterized protein n=1 Tax=Holdemania filiformis DSM 12042 TaxID=545696 RepID=B9YDH2_9FIRM|nr:hypothetical protein HOLDEFILI_03895 [Holdemania filiformis DSM 12042]
MEKKINAGGRKYIREDAENSGLTPVLSIRLKRRNPLEIFAFLLLF